MDWQRAIALAVVLLASGAWGHSGGLDDNGGHLDRQTREYHCHATGCLLPQPPPNASSSNSLSLVSFNIQFLGHGKHRDNTALATLMAPHDLVVVQELVAPPYPGTFPDGSPYRPDPESAAFFDAMADAGFAYVLSEEDSGTGDRLHLNNTATEWWVAFYKPTRLSPAPDLPSGYLATDRSNHPDYERVPYAFGFRVGEDKTDFVVISVHLQPGDRAADTARRAHELSAIAGWVEANDEVERDFLIVGDMNFEDCAEITAIMPPELHPLNQGQRCKMTNTNVNGPRHYDNILLPKDQLPDWQGRLSMHVVNLINAMRQPWVSNYGEQYPGDPYDHNRFRAKYSDHHPIVVALPIGLDKD